MPPMECAFAEYRVPRNVAVTFFALSAAAAPFSSFYPVSSTADETQNWSYFLKCLCILQQTLFNTISTSTSLCGSDDSVKS